MAELVCTLMLSFLSAPDEKLIVLDKASSPSNMMTTYLNRLADEASERRTEDVLVCARYLARYSAERGPREVHVIATGECGPPVLHAVALEPGCFASLRLERSVRSWSEVARTPLARQQLMNTVHGAPRVYDLPDLLSHIPKDRVAVKDSLKLAEEKGS